MFIATIEFFKKNIYGFLFKICFGILILGYYYLFYVDMQMEMNYLSHIKDKDIISMIGKRDICQQPMKSFF